MSAILHVGLIVNPLAGLGGSLALKGSDGEQLRATAEQLQPEQRDRAFQRTLRALTPLLPHAQRVRFSCWAGEMGERVLARLEFDRKVLGNKNTGLTSASDTRLAATTLLDADVDLILFAGGDGTARDIHDVIGNSCPVLGIPAGVKMHSGVFTVSPEAAGELLIELIEGGLVDVRAQEVRDIDEDAFRRDMVRSRFYGDLMVPGEGRFLQHTKVSGREDAALVAADIATWEVENMVEGCLYLVGPGSTTAAVMSELGLDNTLLGVDVVRDGCLLDSDVDEGRLLQLLRNEPGPYQILVTAIGGQGHLFGRGNQQFSPTVIRAVGVGNITVLAAKSKLAGLAGRPLLVDTNDAALDRDLCGLWTVVTGYDDQVLYRVSNL
jgi:predicted polyphosphate/ATP-dependent NAD kinase